MMLGIAAGAFVLAFVVGALAAYIVSPAPNDRSGNYGPVPSMNGPGHDGAPAAPNATATSDVAFDLAALEESEAIFVHRATPENTSANSTYLDNLRTDVDPNTLLLVTQNWNPGGSGGTYNDHPIGVWYDRNRSKWAIFNQDRATMPVGANFNVVVVGDAAETQ